MKKKTKKVNIPRKLSLVRFNATGLNKKMLKKYPFKKDDTYIFLGEIPNMAGHVVVLDIKKHKIYSGYHIENFVELADDSL
ncbi:MAG: hypothetical protein PHI84_02215 [Kiritimatiellae bacterium]|nr:hypothetical protein [Kiritimatiellia bacterium]